MKHVIARKCNVDVSLPLMPTFLKLFEESDLVMKNAGLLVISSTIRHNTKLILGCMKADSIPSFHENSIFFHQSNPLLTFLRRLSTNRRGGKRCTELEGVTEWAKSRTRAMIMLSKTSDAMLNEKFANIVASIRKNEKHKQLFK